MRILVTYATAGAGHRKAAEAIFDSLVKLFPNDASIVDSLDYTSPFYKKLYSGVYTFLITVIPWAWGIVFWLIDLPVLRPFVLLCRRIQNGINAAAFQRYLIGKNYDVVISTHFMANEVCAHLKKQKKIRSKLVAVITDYDVHSIWLANEIDVYAVATDWTKRKLVAMGVPSEKVFITGIPTHEKFTLPKNVTTLKNQYGLQNRMLTVLIATGSFGIGPIEEIIQNLADFQVLVICGHNKNLYGRLSPQASDRVKIFGLVNNMDEMMAMSDVMITKPGGLSISEALVMGLPMIFFNEIPGQETNNVKVLKNYGIGLSGLKISQMNAELKRLSNNPAELNEIKKRIRGIARPAAVKEIIDLSTRPG